ncbi:MAG: EAL domain-containing protein, partial [Lachnospiraceae bacterium]|nr:EAL domain-containing protein [Lachnospiraceae bacterium]
DFADKIIKVIESNNVPREYIEVELTESFGYENLKAFTDFVSRMNKEGISVSLDDFGTGYSSLSVLKDINVDVVKIDKTFIDRICCGNVINEKLLINVIHMIKDLGHEIICEGVEKKEQAEFLKQQECYFIQGYLYDRPLPHDEFTERLKSPVYR